jgi:hypothetical protein
MGWLKSKERNIAGKKRRCEKMYEDKKFMAYLSNLVSGKIFSKPGQEIAKSQIQNVIFKLERASWLTVTDGDANQAEDLYGFYQEWSKNEM